MTKQKTLKENRKGHRATKPSQSVSRCAEPVSFFYLSKGLNMSKIIIRNCKCKLSNGSNVCTEKYCPFWYDDPQEQDFCTISSRVSYGCEITIDIKYKEQPAFKMEIEQ